MQKVLKEFRESDVEKRLLMVESWGQRKEREFIPLLIIALGDPEWRVRKATSATLLLFEPDGELIEGLIGALKEGDNVGSRNAAVEILIKLGRFSVFPLMSAFRDVDHDVKKFILDILGEIGDQRATTFMINALSDGNDNVRMAAVEALGKLKDFQAVPALLSLMEDTGSLLNFTVIRALEAIGDSRALDTLVSMMNKKELEKAILEALGSFGDLRALNPILSSLQIGNKGVKHCAIRSLLNLSNKTLKHQEILISGRFREIYAQEIGLYLIGALEENDARVKRAAIKILGWVCEVKAIKKLIPLLKGELRDEVVAALIRMGRKAVDILIAEIQRYPEGIREGIALVLGEIGDRRAGSALITLLGDSNGHVRQAAAHSLGKLRDRNAIKPLVKVLGDCYPNVQEAAEEALSLIGGELLVALLKGLANHAQSPQRCHAITLLGRLAPEESLPEITLAFKDEDPHVRKAAVEAMGGIRSPESDSAIIRSLADEVPMVRLATLSVLFQRKEIACLQHVEPLVKDENIWVRAAVARGLGDQGGPVKPFLLDLLRDKVGVVQIAAMEALGKLRDASVVPIILSMTETQDADVREAAIASLGQLGDGSAKEALRTFLDDSHWGVRAAAATALGRLQDNLVRDSLLRLATQDQDALVRQSAQFALDQLQEP